MKTITDENGDTEWAKLDAIAANAFASFKYSAPVGDAGINFNDDLDVSQRTQKQRQIRKRTELAAETKPMSLTQQQMGEKDFGSKKLAEISRKIAAVTYTKVAWLRILLSNYLTFAALRKKQWRTDSILSPDHWSR